MKATLINRLLAPSIFVIVLLIGLAMTFFVYRAEQLAAESRFDVLADDAADRLRGRVEQHVAFLRAAHAFFVSQDGQVSHRSFATFVEGLDLTTGLPGIQGIGFARLIDVGEEADVSVRIGKSYGIERDVWPDTTDQTRRTPIELLEPHDERNDAALGYDMFSEPTRRAAMIGALAFDGPFATAPVELVQEITKDKQAGFLVYIPARTKLGTSDVENVEGFVYAPFRAGDLHAAALRRAPALPVLVETHDVTGNDPVLLYRSPGLDTTEGVGAFEDTSNFEVAGRRWQIHVMSTPAFGSRLPSLGILALGSISLLLAAALAASTRSQIKALEVAQQLHRNTAQNLEDKELLLQEMKHRIKNSIARVLAIARHTAAHSADLPSFTGSFTARLQAMANAQDMLTRSHWQRADLNELISTELRQVFGDELSSYTLTGPAIELNERATQALGLVIHELATNALKYGGVSGEGDALKVKWQKHPKRRSDRLVLEWSERSDEPIAAPESSGFGTKLIDANIRGELGGTVERDFTQTGLFVRLTMPLKALA